MPGRPFYFTQHDALVDLGSQATLIPLVNEALRNCQSLLALSRSPLANSALVKPALVKDDLSPTAEERGAALRLVLQWAVTRIAPAAAPHPFGVYRPLNDPTWRDPRWWRYTILRHRYLEPLHPDDFTGGGRFTETLLALTGISSADAYYDERSRAILDVVEWLRRQLLDHAYHGELQQLALQEALAPLEQQPRAGQLLAIASTFDDIFPREQLVDLAVREGIDRPAAALDDLIAARFLLTGDGGVNLWLSPPLRAHLYPRQPAASMHLRHRLIAAHDAVQGRVLSAARHYQRGGQDDRAARLLLAAGARWIQEAPLAALIELLQTMSLRRLKAEERCAIHLQLSDLLRHTGDAEAALAACRQALQVAVTPDEQARAYRRIGKLYESRNPQHALRYYQQAIERFPAGAPELAEALKDRGWLYFLGEEWTKAESDLLCALELVHTDARSLQGDIYDAMANLYRKSGAHSNAVRYAELALALREEEGDLLGVAKSHGNLGLLYRAAGDYTHAIAAYTEAMATYARLGNQELVAVALLNIGAACFLAGNVAEAVERYQASLTISRTLELALLEIKAHYNLAEAYGALAQRAVAREHWELGIHLCRRHAFDDQERDFVALGAGLALAAPPAPPVPTAQPVPATVDAPGYWSTMLDQEEAAVLELAQRERKVTAQRLVEALHVSRATATRRLTALVEKELLQMVGKGRGVHYRPASATPAPVALAATLEPAINALVPRLRTEFSVTALRISPPPAAGVLRLAVRFAAPPDLESFFALEAHLGAMLQCVVDLVPDSPVDAPGA